MIDDAKPPSAMLGSDEELAMEPSETERLSSEIAELKDRLLRALAETENLRRRSERDVKDAGTYAISKFARDMLSVVDNLRSALATAPAEARLETSVAFTILQGIELTERGLLQALERHGVKEIAAQGTKFDPNLHQAMVEIPHPTATPGTVAEVMQQGYVIGERVLRPALVGVAKAAPKPAPVEMPGGSVDKVI